MSKTKSANRYAKALLDLANEKGQLDEVLQDIHLVGGTIEENAELQSLLESPIVKTDKKQSILNQIFGGKVGELCLNFISLLATNGREAHMHSMAVAFDALVKEQRNILTAIAESAVALDAESRAKIMTLVKSQSTGEVDLHEVINPDLIGGFTLRMGDKMIDASISGKLKKMKKEWVGDASPLSLN